MFGFKIWVDVRNYIIDDKLINMHVHMQVIKWILDLDVPFLISM